MIDVIWVPSWYPSVESIQNGDFIERHANSTSNYANITLFYIQSSTKVKSTIFTKKIRNDQLIENLTIFPAITRLRFINLVRFCLLFIKSFKENYKGKKKPDLVHIHVSFKAGLVALWLKYRYNLPYIITEHWSFFNPNNSNNYLNSNFLFKLLFKLIFNNSLYVLPVSEGLNGQLKAFFPRISSIVVPNVVDDKLFFFNRLVDEGGFKFIHVSSLIQLKNPRGIINVFLLLRKKYDFIEMEIIGSTANDLKDDLVNDGLIKDLIKFTSLLPHDMIARQMQTSNVFVLFSQYENLPCVIAESLCCGVPVVSSSVGGVPEMVDESNGILVPPGDEEALYKAMESMILNYSKYDRKQISENAQAKYNPDVVGKQIADVYEKVLSKK